MELMESDRFENILNIFRSGCNQKRKERKKRFNHSLSKINENFYGNDKTQDGKQKNNPITSDK